MKNVRGFTLIELLIVVAIIAILAAIAVPNFLEAQTRAKVSRVMSDMRTVATAIESYSVDYNGNPLSAVNQRVESVNNNTQGSLQWSGSQNDWVVNSSYFGVRNGQISVNAHCVDFPDDTHAQSEVPTPQAGFYRCTFAHPVMTDRKVGLTTPVAYIAALPYDPFTKNPFVNYGYTALADKGWMLWSAGPDMDLSLNADRDGLNGSPLDLAFGWTPTSVTTTGATIISATGAPAWNVLSLGKSKDEVDDNGWAEFSFTSPNNNDRVEESAYLAAKPEWETLVDHIPYDIYGTNPSSGLLHMTYDATNGSLSSGDVWKQND